MATDSCIPGLAPGEFIRDPLHPALLAAVPRGKEPGGKALESEADYISRLIASRAVRFIEREEWLGGGIKLARADAARDGVPILCPLTELERDNEARQAPPSPRINQSAFRAAVQRFERDGSIGPRPAPADFTEPAA